jgi:hypothetical protein
MRDVDGRPINQLVVGERGDGSWPSGYRGAEHIEMPNNTPQPDDDTRCANTNQYCAQYSLDEAGAYTRAGIPWWKACDPGALGYLDHIEPIEVTQTPTSLRIIYEGRLVKRATALFPLIRADGTFPWTNPTGCHEDWLFPDGVRRPVYLRVGCELHANAPKVDRLMQVRNPDGNPSFSGPFSFIGGYVITKWLKPMPAKAIDAFFYPELDDVETADGSHTFHAGTWNALYTDQIVFSDIVFGWLNQPFRLSAEADGRNGRTLRLSNIGPSDNGDTGFCLCVNHGGIEMGGGLLHSAPVQDAALPIAGGKLSIEARRRLETEAPTVIRDTPPWKSAAEGEKS